MDVLTIGRKYRSAADEAPQHGESGLKNRQTERDNRNSYGNGRGRLLSTRQRQGTEHKSDEQAPAVTKKDGRRIEIETQKTQDCSSQSNGQKRYEGRTAEDCHHKNDQCRKQRRTGG